MKTKEAHQVFNLRLTANDYELLKAYTKKMRFTSMQQGVRFLLFTSDCLTDVKQLEYRSED